MALRSSSRSSLGHDPTSTVGAFDLTVIDPLLPGLNFVPNSSVYVAGQAPTVLLINGPLMTAIYDHFALGATSTIQFQATLSSQTVPGQLVPNAAAVFYTTLPGSEITPISPYNPVSNNFAESNPTSLSGCVYWGVNHNGRMDSPDFGIAGVLPNSSPRRVKAGRAEPSCQFVSQLCALFLKAADWPDAFSTALRVSATSKS